MHLHISKFTLVLGPELPIPTCRAGEARVFIVCVIVYCGSVLQGIKKCIKKLLIFFNVSLHFQVLGSPKEGPEVGNDLWADPRCSSMVVRTKNLPETAETTDKRSYYLCSL